MLRLRESTGDDTRGCVKLNCSKENLYNLRGLGRAASSISRCVDRERNERNMCGTRRRGENSAAIGERNTTWQHNREVSAAQKRKGHEWRCPSWSGSGSGGGPAGSVALARVPNFYHFTQLLGPGPLLPFYAKRSSLLPNPQPHPMLFCPQIAQPPPPTPLPSAVARRRRVGGRGRTWRRSHFYKFK